MSVYNLIIGTIHLRPFHSIVRHLHFIVKGADLANFTTDKMNRIPFAKAVRDAGQIGLRSLDRIVTNLQDIDYNLVHSQDKRRKKRELIYDALVKAIRDGERLNAQRKDWAQRARTAGGPKKGPVTPFVLKPTKFAQLDGEPGTPTSDSGFSIFLSPSSFQRTVSHQSNHVLTPNHFRHRKIVDNFVNSHTFYYK